MVIQLSHQWPITTGGSGSKKVVGAFQGVVYEDFKRPTRVGARWYNSLPIQEYHHSLYACCYNGSAMFLEWHPLVSGEVGRDIGHNGW